MLPSGSTTFRGGTSFRGMTTGKRQILESLMDKDEFGSTGLTTIGFGLDCAVSSSSMAGGCEKRRMSVDPSSTSPTSVATMRAVSASRKRVLSDMSLCGGTGVAAADRTHGGTPLKRRMVSSRSTTPTRRPPPDENDSTLMNTMASASGGSLSRHSAGFSFSAQTSMTAMSTSTSELEQTRLEMENQRLRQELYDSRKKRCEDSEASEASKAKRRRAMIELLRADAETERVKRQQKFLAANEKIGRMHEKMILRSGRHEQGQVWEEGSDIRDWNRRKGALVEEKHYLANHRKGLNKRRKEALKEIAALVALESTTGVTPTAAMASAIGSSVTGPLATIGGMAAAVTSAASGVTAVSGSIASTGFLWDDNSMSSETGFTSAIGGSTALALRSSPPSSIKNCLAYQRLRSVNIELELVKFRNSQVTKEMAQVREEETRLKSRRQLHVKSTRLMHDERQSNMKIGQLLDARFVLMQLLGKGGFSEVFRAYDLEECRFVACKLHQLNTSWSDERKKNYSKHAAREYDIHKSLEHPRIVKLHAVFGIDINTFCTVLEYCEGYDLDIVLRMHHHLSEKETRSIMAQVFDALRYLSEECEPTIIHYDLKPGNILYFRGVAKITDFGLAKMLEDSRHELELTSQGAGTYWYLPPECFAMGRSPPMISTSVDIWSAGVVFYQLLFGTRPFGDSWSQERLAKMRTMLQSVEVQFPEKPLASDTVKALLRDCLRHEPRSRPTASYILRDHEYYNSLST